MFWEGGWEWSRLIGSYDTLGQTPHFYRPGQAAPCRTVSATVATQPHGHLNEKYHAGLS